MASDSEEYDEMPISPRGKKRLRGKKTGTAAPAAKRILPRSVDVNIGHGGNLGLPTPSGLPTPLESPLPLSKGTRNINRFMKLYNDYNFKDKGDYCYDSLPQAVHVREKEGMPGRNYAFAEQALRKVNIDYPNTYGADDENYPNGKMTYWVLEARDPDNANKALRILSMFQVPNHGKRGPRKTTRNPQTKKTVMIPGERPFPPAGAITTAISDDRDEVIELGHIACEILNKAPADIDWQVGEFAGKKSWLPWFQRFVERTALSIWRPKLDFRRMPRVYFKQGVREEFVRLHNFYATTNSTPKDDAKKEVFQISYSDPGLLARDSQYPQLSVNVALSQVSSEACAGRESCPENSCYDVAYTGKALNMTNPVIANKVNAAIRILNKSLYDLQGFVGTSAQLTRLLKRTMAEYGVGSVMGTQGSGSLIVDGFLDAGRIFRSLYRVDDTLRPTLSTRLFGLIDTNRPLQNADQDIFHRHMLQTHSLHCIDIAYIKQALLTALGRTQKLVPAIFAAAVAGDQVELELITHEEMRQCNCETDAHRASVQHPCGRCGDICLCAEMHQTDGGDRVFDTKCYKILDKIEPMYPVSTMETRLRRRLGIIKRKADVNLDIETVLPSLLKFVLSDDSYEDGYNGTVADARAPTIAGNTRVCLDNFSIEKPLQATWHDGVVGLHTEHNVILCRMIYNLVRRDSIVALMPWFPVLLHCQDVVQDMDPQKEYHAAVKEQMQAFDASTDDAWHIRTKLPLQNKARSATKLSPQAWQTLEKESRSGVWQGGFVPGQKARLWRMKKDGVYPDRTKVDGQDWTGSTIATLKKNIDYMQQSKKFNKYDLKLDRNEDGSPQLWRPQRETQGITWAELNREFQCRLSTWRNSCNRLHKTDESAATLFLLYVIWWFRTGGKCPILGFMLTPWLLHDAIYSFGRGIWYLDGAGNPTPVPIVAGTVMKSGFTSTLPKDMAKDFDFTEMTVQVEAWKGNLLRFHWPVEMYPEVFKRFKAIASEKEGLYEAVKSKEEYRTFSTKLDKAEEVSDAAADIVDDEDDFYEAALAARMEPAPEDMVVVAEDSEEEKEEAEDDAVSTTHGETEEGAYIGEAEEGAYIGETEEGAYIGETEEDLQAEAINALRQLLVQTKRLVATEYTDLWIEDESVHNQITELQSAAHAGDQEEYGRLQEHLEGYLDERRMNQVMAASMATGLE